MSQAAELLSVSPAAVYELASAGALTKRFIGSGRRNFRLSYAEVEAYAASLPTEPID